jgi:hypothetical protein
MFYPAKRTAGCITATEDDLLLISCMLHGQTSKTVEPRSLSAAAHLFSLPGMVHLNIHFARKASLRWSGLHDNFILIFRTIANTLKRGISSAFTKVKYN